MADFNGDGKPDVAAAQTFENAIAVYLGRGGGSFDLSRDFELSSFPIALVAGDFSRDGKEDLVALHFLSYDRYAEARISVLLGRGDGTFEFPRTFPIEPGTYPGSLVAADFDGNGSLDIAVTASNRIFVLLGSGSGEFRDPTSLSAGDPPWRGVEGFAAGDFDSDGKADLVITRLNDHAISILLGTGSGSFVLGRTYAVERLPKEVVVRDLDGDGDLDLLVNSQDSIGVSVLLGNGSGSFERKTIVPASRYPVGLVVADVDGDGQPDLALGESFDRRRLLLFTGNGDGTFREPRVISEAFASPRIATDLTGDGRPDLLVSNLKGLLLYAGDGTGEFRPPAVLETNRRPSSVVASDMDSNGTVDLVVGTGSTDADRINLFSGSGNGSFVRGSNLVPSGPVRGMVVADINRDGRRDLVVSTAAPSCLSVGGRPVPCAGPNVSVFLGAGGGSFAQPMSTELPGADPGGLAVVDLNEDGWLDVAVTDSRRGNLLTLFGTGTGGFSNPVPWATGGSPKAVSAGSFNGDGTVDLAVVDAAFHRVVILLGNGMGGFFATEAFPSGERPVAVASADLDGDGKLDLVVANAWSRTISMFGGFGNGGFAPRVDTSVRFAPSWIVVDDWNGDGNLDVAAATFVASNSVDADNTSTVAVLSNVAGGLSAPAYVRVGRHPASIASADVNGDQRPDLITANGSSDDVSILRNTCKRLLPPLLRRK